MTPVPEETRLLNNEDYDFCDVITATKNTSQIYKVIDMNPHYRSHFGSGIEKSRICNNSNIVFMISTLAYIKGVHKKRLQMKIQY